MTNQHRIAALETENALLRGVVTALRRYNRMRDHFNRRLEFAVADCLEGGRCPSMLGPAFDAAQDQLNAAEWDLGVAMGWLEAFERDGAA